jgi:hypothetical protein
MADDLEIERSEPGTGNPPVKFTDHIDVSGDYKGRGIRRDTPPIAWELAEEDNE